MRRHLLDPVGRRTGGRRGRSSLRRPGTGRVVRRARRPRQAAVVAPRRGRARVAGRSPDQDVGHAGHAAPPQGRGCRGVSLARRVRPFVGAAELAALLRHDPEADGRAAPRRARRARGWAPDAGRSRDGDRRAARAAPPRRRAAVGLGNTPQAPRVAGSTSASERAGGPASPSCARRTRARAGAGCPTRRRRLPRRSPPTCARTGRRRSRRSGTGWPEAGSASDTCGAWFGALGPRLEQVDVDGEPAFVLAEDLDELASTAPTASVRLLPGFDQYVLGPGTADGHVVPRPRRRRGQPPGGVDLAGRGGRRCRPRGPGSWTDSRVCVTWFGEAGRPPRTALRTEVTRLSSILDRSLGLTITRP